MERRQPALQVLPGRADGEDWDWTAVYRENAVAIYRYVYARVGNRPDAEDLTTQVFLPTPGAPPSSVSPGAPPPGGSRRRWEPAPPTPGCRSPGPGGGPPGWAGGSGDDPRRPLRRLRRCPPRGPAPAPLPGRGRG